MDCLHALLKWIDHNRWTLLSLLLIGILIFAGWGCRPRTASLSGDGTVTASQLQAQALEAQQDLVKRRIELESQMQVFNQDVESLEQRLAHAREDLQRQIELRKDILALLGNAATDALDGSFSARGFVVPAISLLAAAFGVGKTLDNRRKDRVIRRLKVENAAAPIHAEAS
jgi:TolA-binding protein